MPISNVEATSKHINFELLRLKSSSSSSAIDFRHLLSPHLLAPLLYLTIPLRLFFILFYFFIFFSEILIKMGGGPVGVDFTVFKGSGTGAIVEATGHRDPGPTEVIVKITHCGVCGTDEHYLHADQGLGHEGVGIITEVGSMVHALSEFRVGDRVGMGWFHKFCGYCDACLRGNQNQCANKTEFGTADIDQGCFGTAVAWDISALFKIPDEIASEHAGPLMCGGATVWHPLADFGLKAGSRVGVLGVGGLGHLAIQFAAKMGMEVVVFSGTESKRQQAIELGASEFYVTSSGKPLEGIEKVNALLITANVAPDMALYFPVLAQGALIFPMTISAENLKMSPLDLVLGNLRVIGTAIGPAASIRAMLRFAEKQGIKPIVETFPMTKAGVEEAMQKLREGRMRYRGVLVV
ncbi:NADP-dependent alcohol dehydrogenase [Immersiella caudata]|uniref:NADP-dependent alcohol dehydrogenase n=1 Tax=Immersiella caudata TaxID=314043 RepID=A0AA39U217_9PEZI|nr:NADP-dependent alcohol dehydrogenase [Immersiella caudata]